jgi:hypothetical protein
LFHAGDFQKNPIGSVAENLDTVSQCICPFEINIILNSKQISNNGLIAQEEATANTTCSFRRTTGLYNAIRVISTKIFQRVIAGHRCVEVICTSKNKIFCLKPYIFTVVQQFQEADHAAIVHLCNWFCTVMFRGEVYRLLAYFIKQALFHFVAHVNNQNNKYFSAYNPRQLCEVLLHDFKFGLCCAISATKIIGATLFSDTISAQRYIRKFPQTFFKIE